MGQLGLVKKDKRFRQGVFEPRNKEKFAGKQGYAIYRSGLELNYFRILDDNPAVIQWGSEEVVVPYFFNGKWHNYFIDLFVVLKNGNRIARFFIELKPYSQTVEPEYKPRRKKENYLYECLEWQKNQAKWAAAKSFATKKGYEFHVLTEKDLEEHRR